MEINKRALIVANGDNEPDFLKNIHKDYDFVISADGASNLLFEVGITPDIIVGDFDSISKSILLTYEASGIRQFRLSAEKDFSDTHVSVDIAIQEGANTIDIAGGLGSRWDHSIANLNLLYYGYQKQVNLSLISSENKARLIGPGEHVFPAKNDDYLSFFALFEDGVISIENMKYKLFEQEIKRGESIGLSNEYEGDGRITIHKGSLLAVHSRKDTGGR